jgi:hypothetical protein
MHIGYWWESQKERDHWEDQDVGVWTKMDLREIGLDGVDLIDMALVNTVLNVRVP